MGRRRGVAGYLAAIACGALRSLPLAAAMPMADGSGLSNITISDSLSSVAAPSASCTVKSHSELHGAMGCQHIVISGIQVPTGQSIDLDLKSGTTVDFPSAALNTSSAEVANIRRLQVTFEGMTSFAASPKPGRTKPLISISGSNVKIIGAPGHKINGNGDKYWDGVGSNSGRTIDKPKFLRLKLQHSTISGLHLLNTPVHAFSISGCKSLTLDKINIDNRKGNAKGGPKGGTLGHNTDAFDVGDSSDITISNAYIDNQDDCLAINSGTGITFVNGTCIGGHGLSIGSVGGRSNNVVANVKIINSKIIDSENGVRIKTKAGQGKGSVSNVTYRNIELKNITKRGIVIQQDYENGGPTGKPGADIKISHITLENITGSVKSGGANIYLLCAAGGCSDWTWSNIKITGGTKTGECRGAPPSATKYCGKS
jgi:polygalacturonase